MNDNFNQTFKVQVETGEIMDAELLSIVRIDNKEYAVYSLDNKNGTIDILASYVIKDAEGYDKLLDIIDPTDKAKISKFIRELVA